MCHIVVYPLVSSNARASYIERICAACFQWTELSLRILANKQWQSVAFGEFHASTQSQQCPGIELAGLNKVGSGVL